MRYALLLGLLLAACSPTSRTAEWFATHPEETSRVLYRCENHLQADAECDAARAALVKKQEDRMKLFRRGF